MRQVVEGPSLPSCGHSVIARHYSERLEVEMTDASEVTGRDSYVIAQALYEFIRLEQSKPMAERRGSDERDARAILHELFDDELQLLVRSDEAAGLTPPDCKRRVTIGG